MDEARNHAPHVGRDTKPTRDVRSNTTKLASCFSRAGVLKEISKECLGNVGVEVLPNIVLVPLG